MTLVELTKLWKENKLTDAEVIEEYQKIEVFHPIEEDDEIYYTCGNGNSWLEVTTINKFRREDVINFKKLVGEIR